jgi:hypothetical protein
MITSWWQLAAWTPRLLLALLVLLAALVIAALVRMVWEVFRP